MAEEQKNQMSREFKELIDMVDRSKEDLIKLNSSYSATYGLNKELKPSDMTPEILAHREGLRSFGYFLSRLISYGMIEKNKKPKIKI